jgi:hypothetical protein
MSSANRDILTVSLPICVKRKKIYCLLAEKLYDINACIGRDIRGDPCNFYCFHSFDIESGILRCTFEECFVYSCISPYLAYMC